MTFIKVSDLECVLDHQASGMSRESFILEQGSNYYGLKQCAKNDRTGFFYCTFTAVWGGFGSPMS